GGDRERRDIYPAVGREFERGDAAEAGDVLVLLADGFVQNIDLDPAGLFGEHLARDEILVQRVKRAQECDREAAAGAEAGARRDVGHADDLQVLRPYGDQLERLADDGVLDVLDLLHYFTLRILNEVFVLESLVK